MTLAVCLALTGCTPLAMTPPKARITAGFTAMCNVTAEVTPPDKTEPEKFAFSGRIKRLGSGFWEISITSPDTLAGLKISLSGDTVTSSLGELWHEDEVGDIPAASPFMTIFRSLDSAAVAVENGQTLTAAKGVENSWTLAAGGSNILFDEQGVPTAMTMAGISVEFSEFALLDTDTTLGKSESESEEDR